jgi:hypothetical protein
MELARTRTESRSLYSMRIVIMMFTGEMLILVPGPGARGQVLEGDPPSVSASECHNRVNLKVGLGLGMGMSVTVT